MPYTAVAIPYTAITIIFIVLATGVGAFVRRRTSLMFNKFPCVFAQDETGINPLAKNPCCEQLP